MSLDPLVYVCVMSNFNLPEWEACLARRPSDVVLLVSDGFEAAQKGAEHMQTLLYERLPGVRVYRPASKTLALQGDDALAAQVWLQQVLMPYLDHSELAGKPRVLNMTGGTKSMQLALLTTIRWDQLDYTPYRSGKVQAIGLAAPPLGALSDLGSDALQPASAEEVARLYNDSVTFDPPNLLWQRPSSLELADENAALAEMFAALSRLWVDGSAEKAWQQAELSLGWEEFLGSGVSKPDGELLVWLEAVARLAPECWSISEAGIRLPGSLPDSKMKKYSIQYALKRWLQSDWWEGLAHARLLEAGVPKRAVACNVHAGEEARKSSTQREADLLVHHWGRTTVVEVKVLQAPGQAPREMENQVSALAERFGRTDKVLLVSPLVKRSLKESQWNDFTARCRANKVSLCEDRDALLQAVGAADTTTGGAGEDPLA
ncbi:hypothetical protein [uncultured Halomonas sp.]|uniref:hypothetical protein n=1 Tax=uncultured Halomonas sp. TaxID=173971 RepID=UPI002632DD60|nr:hypothetical protein [uncultured Halomonas sp.]